MHRRRRSAEEVAMSENSWPIDPASGRFLCSLDHPMPKGAEGRWAHTNIECIGESSDFDTGQEFDIKRCKDCGVTWYEEVAQ